MLIHHETLPLHEVFGSLTIPVFGLEPSLSCCVTRSLKNDKPSAVLELDRENLEVAWYLPCVSRGTQGKKPPQSPGGGRSGRSVEDHLEKPTLGETLEGTFRPAGGVPVVRPACAGRTPVEGIPEKNYGVSLRPFSHLCGPIAWELCSFISCSLTEREETEEATC